MSSYLGDNWLKGRVGAKSYFMSLIAVLIVTDIAILLDIPVLRQVLGFLCFVIVPGLLILRIFERGEIGFLKQLLLSVGLSISFLMFGGLLINSILPTAGYSTPLSTTSLVISFSVIIAVLCFVAYRRNRTGFQPPSIPRFQMSDNKWPLLLLLFPVIFPLLSVLGIRLMDAVGNNIILVMMLFMIPAYIISLVCLRNRVSEATYPLAIWTIGLALLLMTGLRSDYIMGTDNYVEYLNAGIVAGNLRWSPGDWGLPYCLSISLLPTVFQSLLGIDVLYVYKAVFPLIFSLIPLGCFVLSRRYLSTFHSFLASFFFIAQIGFIFNLVRNARTGVAVLFFALMMILLSDKEINTVAKRAFFFIFSLSVVVSHYSSTYIAFFVILAYWLITKALAMKFRVTTNISGMAVGTFLVSLFFWYGEVFVVPFAFGVSYFRQTFYNLMYFFTGELRNPVVMAIFSPAGIIPETISVVIHDITFILIGIGVLVALIKFKDKKIDLDYSIMMAIALLLLAAMIALPYVAKGYSAIRTYTQVLVLLAPAFFLGGEAASRYFRPRLRITIITGVLLLQFLCATFLIYQFFGIPYSENLNTSGSRYDIYYVSKQETVAAEWLCKQNAGDLDIYGDAYIGMRFQMMGQDIHSQFHLNMNDLGGPPWDFNLVSTYSDQRIKVNSGFTAYSGGKKVGEEPVEGRYIYLRHANVVNGLIYEGKSTEAAVAIGEYSYLFDTRDKIYTNGAAEVYK